MDDGVNRDGLDYRAGWLEALRAISRNITVEGMRANKRLLPGMDRANEIAHAMYTVMIAKTRGPAYQAPTAAPQGDSHE